MRFNDPEMLHGLWLPVLFLAVFLYGFWQKDRALRKFAETGLLRHINVSVSRARQWVKAALVLLAVMLIVVALTRPAWNPRPHKMERRGRDVVFLLDVSKSMQAEDLKPNRLERAKLGIRYLIARLEGDRVALVAFAGHAVVKCPLTLDYGFFQMMLNGIDTRSVSRGGTLIGDALRATMDKVFNDPLKRYRDIILITDGEDHESFPVEAARAAGQQGIRLIAIGLGDENEGRRIPVTNENGERVFMKYRGKEVWTRLDARALRRMVSATPGGRYLNVATGTFDLGEIYEKLVASAKKRRLESQMAKRYEEKFQIFLATGLFVLLAEMLVSERRKPS